MTSRRFASTNNERGGRYSMMLTDLEITAGCWRRTDQDVSSQLPPEVNIQAIDQRVYSVAFAAIAGAYHRRSGSGKQSFGLRPSTIDAVTNGRNDIAIHRSTTSNDVDQWRRY